MTTELSEWVHTLETVFKRLQQPTAEESSSVTIPQKDEMGHHESIHDIIQPLFIERDTEDIPVMFKSNDIRKCVKADVADFPRCLKPQFCLPIFLFIIYF